MKLLSTLLLAVMFTSSVLAADAPLRHVVHFKFKADADQTQIQKVVEEFAALKGKIKEVSSVEYGTNVSPEGLDNGFTHCWIVTFKDAKDRDAYLVHPDHKAFVALLKPVLEAAFVVDFFAKQ